MKINNYLTVLTENEEPDWVKQNRKKCESNLKGKTKYAPHLEPYVGAESMFDKYPAKPISGIAEKIIANVKKSINNRVKEEVQSFKCDERKSKRSKWKCTKQAEASAYDDLSYGIHHYYINDCLFDVNCASCYKKLFAYANQLELYASKLEKDLKKFRIFTPNEATGVHVGGAFDTLNQAEDMEDDEKDSERIAKKSGGDIIKMQNITENYLIYIQEQEDGYIQEVIPAALAGAASKVAAGASTVAPVVSAMYGALYAIKAANFAYKNMFNKSHKACRGLDKESYTMCVRKYKLMAYQEQIKAMTKAMATCAKDKKPEKCKAKIAEKIKGIKLRIATLKQAIQRNKKLQNAKAQAAGKAYAQQQ